MTIANVPVLVRWACPTCGRPNFDSFYKVARPRCTWCNRFSLWEIVFTKAELKDARQQLRAYVDGRIKYRDDPQT